MSPPMEQPSFLLGEDFVTGQLYYGTKMADVLRAFALAKAQEGKLFYASDESMQKTYAGEVGPDGTLQNLKLFAENGGESVAQDEKGNVYIAAGQVFVYNPSGQLIDTIKVPERPIDLIFRRQGGKDALHSCENFTLWRRHTMNLETEL